jgi:hypothetical protein
VKKKIKTERPYCKFVTINLNGKTVLYNHEDIIVIMDFVKESKRLLDP